MIVQHSVPFKNGFKCSDFTGRSADDHGAKLSPTQIFNRHVVGADLSPVSETSVQKSKDIIFVKIITLITVEIKRRRACRGSRYRV